MSPAERHVLEHSLGWPKCYRNHFCTGPSTDDWATIQRLVDRGLMRVGRVPSEISGGDTVFIVTDAGKQALAPAADPGRSGK